MRSIHWFRSDLRLRDNRGLEAASQADELVPLFVLDERLLASSPARARFLLGCLERLESDLRDRDQRLVVRSGDPVEVVPALCREISADRLHFNRDYGPFASGRDAAVRRAAETDGVSVHEHKDRVVFESDELLTQEGEPYRVYSPFRRAWWQRFERDPEEPSQRCVLPAPVPGLDTGALPSRDDFGDATELPTPGEDAARRRLRSFLERDVGDYAERRDYPAEDATSRLSPYLHLGVISVRLCIDEALQAASAESKLEDGARKWIDELIWRDFYTSILSSHPHVMERNFRPEFDSLEWEDDDEAFAAWCEGRTGYPLIDAGMRQLAATGWMHNRARMVVASFLTKDLGQHWRRGERHFMAKLVDGDPASNNGGWQWSASTGTDAQPWFRIFNPVSQGERFDPEGDYARRWVPELEKLKGKRVHRPWDAPLECADYPARIVDHAAARKRTLERFEAARQGAKA